MYNDMNCNKIICVAYIDKGYKIVLWYYRAMEVLEQKAACQQPETEKRTKDIHFIRSKAKEYKDKIKQMQVWTAESSILYWQLMLGNNGHLRYMWI